MNRDWSQAARRAARSFSAACLSAWACGRGHPPPAFSHALVSVQLAPPNAVAAAGESRRFSATAIYDDSVREDVTARAEWSVSNSSVATVGAAGLVTTLRQGSASVGATVQGVAGAATLTVFPPFLTAVQIPLSADPTPAGSSRQFVALGSYTDGSVHPIPVAWSSSNPSVATIDGSGLAQALASGRTLISATSGLSTASTELTVSGPPSTAIAAFSAAPPTIDPGGTSTLTWSVLHAAALSIDQGIGDVTGTTQITVSPGVTTRYTLTASGASGKVTASAIVRVTAKGQPAIVSFTASPSVLAPGQASTLSWEVSDATTLSIDNGVGAVAGTSKTISPAATTLYTLTASNALGTVTATVSVAVIVASRIASFSAGPSPIVAGQAVTLDWSVSPGSRLTLDGAPLDGSKTSATVFPSASHTWRLVATDGAGGTSTAGATVTVSPVAPGPSVSAFAADAPILPVGEITTLRWSVANAATVSISPGPGSLSGSSVAVSPSATTTYTLTATSAAGSARKTATVVVRGGGFVAQGSSGPAAVTFSLHSGRQAHPISRFVYGYNASSLNAPLHGPSPTDLPDGATYLRMGGNRWSGFNWVTNASNTGTDADHRNDDGAGLGSTPGEATRPTIAADRAASPALGTLVTIPMQGWVAADEAGPVSLTAPLTDRFRQSMPRKSGPFAWPPDTSDPLVHEDEYVHFLASQFPTAWTDPVAPLHLSLDNEVDRWNEVHGEVERAHPTYAEIVRKTIDLASAIKDEVPQATLFGLVSSGFNGLLTLQDAPDATKGEWFLDFFLRKLKEAGDAQGRRLVEVLDLHWYSEVQVNGVRVVALDNTPAMQAARVQAPRSLWDPTYVESSWITASSLHGPIHLLPTLHAKIAAAYPGTKISFSEYSHGGGDDISGGVAEADSLGIFGRDDVYAAMFWALNPDDRFIHGAFRMFRDFDAAGGAFGDTSFQALCSDDSLAAVYASMDEGHPERVVVVAINRTVGPLTAALELTHSQSLTLARRYEMTAGAPFDGVRSVLPVAKPDLPLFGNTLGITLPAMSVTTLVLVR